MKNLNSKTLLPIILFSFVLAACNGGPNTSETDNSATSVDPNTTYTVSFDLNYSGAPAAPASQTIQANGLVIEPTAPTRSGYDFTFWATDANGTDEWVFATDVVTADMTMYAKWSEAQAQEKIIYVSLPTWWMADNATVAIYLWKDADNNAWPGVKMNNITGAIYTYSISLQHTNFMFTRISPNEPLTYWGAKTRDLSVEESGSNNLFTISDTAAWESEAKTADGTWSIYSA